MLRNIHIWFGNYLKNIIANQLQKLSPQIKPCKILFTICDHYEPYWENDDDSIAYNRVKQWTDSYQRIAEAHTDFLGNHPKHCFFYPIEEYKKEWLNMISDICRNGFGETEIHLHHDNDTADNLRNTLTDYKKKLSEEHGLLPVSRLDSNVKYGFIHGNWALDNSRPDGRCCGVNNEISVLQDTGCYADFTMPSAPSDTQTKTINSIYYAVDDPEKPKSHNTGKRAAAGKIEDNGFLCIQGPLCFNLKNRKFGLLPKIENGCLSSDMPMTMDRIKMWVNQNIHVQGRRDIIFVKLYTHGTQEKIMDFFFKQGMLDVLFSSLENFCGQGSPYRLYYTSARQMYNVVKGLEVHPNASPESLYDYDLKLQY